MSVFRFNCSIPHLPSTENFTGPFPGEIWVSTKQQQAKSPQRSQLFCFPAASKKGVSTLRLPAPCSFLWRSRTPSRLAIAIDMSSYLEYPDSLLFNRPSPPFSDRQSHLRYFHTFSTSKMAGRSFEFQDFLPIISEKLGGEGLIAELCNGFRLLMDPARGLITFDSLKQNAALLGLAGMGEDELREMLREGDLDGDGALSQMEFCVLMVRLSPELMEGSWQMLEEAFQ